MDSRTTPGSAHDMPAATAADTHPHGDPRAPTALVLGASGGVGGAVARQLREAGWQVRALKRGLGVPRLVRDGMLWLDGDAMNEADVRAAAQGCGVIVHAVNPPGYQRWSELVLPMLDNTLAAAREQGATVLLPGTVYNYGPDAWAGDDRHGRPGPATPVREDAPQRPVTRKGAIRVEMERRLEAAASTGALRVIILRAGDFFGPGAANSWFSQGLVVPGRRVARILNPGTPGVGHQWAYLPDVAAAMVALLARRQQLPAFARFHFAGHWDADGRQLAQAIQRLVQARGGRRPALRGFPWWAVRLASPFMALCRELLEMRDLWRHPLRLDGRRLAAELAHEGGEPHTPLDQALARTLESLGCLAPEPAPAPAAPSAPRIPAIPL